jgi:hypothetical protein
MNILLEFNKSCITGPPECLQACMTSLEPFQVLVYPFLDMSGPHLCDYLQVVREPRNPGTLKGSEPARKPIPALAQGTEDSFPICSIGATVSREIELHHCVWSINWLIGVKVLKY